MIEIIYVEESEKLRKGDNPGFRNLESCAINENCVPRAVKKVIVIALGLGSTCPSFVSYLGSPLLRSLIGSST